jgi:ribosomal protein L11 methyltransferase
MWQILIHTHRNHLELFSAILEEDCVTVSFVEVPDPNAAWDSDDWYIEGHRVEQPHEHDLRLRITLVAKAHNVPEPNLTIQPLPNNNWLEDCWEKFPPQTVGPFFIKSGYYKGDIPKDVMPIVLDAATAFGSGEHGTTAGCMTALSDLKTSGFIWDNPVDVGCGSGILSLAACHLVKTPILAIDNDAEAVRVTAQNAELNQMSHLIQARLGDGLKDMTDSFDLIIANILAAPLIMLAPQMAARLSDNGYIILSGLLDWQEEDVLKAYTDKKFTLHKRYNINRWMTLVLRRV